MSNDVSLTWCKSSYSGDASGNCVEVAPTVTRMFIRDTKNRVAGTQHYSVSAWVAFQKAVSRL